MPDEKPEETPAPTVRTVSNRTKKIQVFNIPCRPDCDGSECFCSVQEMRTVEETPDGTRGVRVTHKRIPGSVTLLAGEKRDLPLRVLDAADVKRAIDRGDLRLL